MTINNSLYSLLLDKLTKSGNEAFSIHDNISIVKTATPNSTFNTSGCLEINAKLPNNLSEAPNYMEDILNIPNSDLSEKSIFSVILKLFQSDDFICTDVTNDHFDTLPTSSDKATTVPNPIINLTDELNKSIATKNFWHTWKLTANRNYNTVEKVRVDVYLIVTAMNKIIDYVISHDLKTPDENFRQLVKQLFCSYNNSDKMYAYAHNTLLLPVLMDVIGLRLLANAGRDTFKSRSQITREYFRRRYPGHIKERYDENDEGGAVTTTPTVNSNIYHSSAICGYVAKDSKILSVPIGEPWSDCIKWNTLGKYINVNELNAPFIIQTNATVKDNKTYTYSDQNPENKTVKVYNSADGTVHDFLKVNNGLQLTTIGRYNYPFVKSEGKNTLESNSTIDTVIYSGVDDTLRHQMEVTLANITPLVKVLSSANESGYLTDVYKDPSNDNIDSIYAVVFSGQAEDPGPVYGERAIVYDNNANISEFATHSDPSYKKPNYMHIDSYSGKSTGQEPRYVGTLG